LRVARAAAWIDQKRYLAATGAPAKRKVGIAKYPAKNTYQPVPPKLV